MEPRHDMVLMHLNEGAHVALHVTIAARRAQIMSYVHSVANLKFAPPPIVLIIPSNINVKNSSFPIDDYIDQCMHYGMTCTRVYAMHSFVFEITNNNSSLQRTNRAPSHVAREFHATMKIKAAHLGSLFKGIVGLCTRNIHNCRGIQPDKVTIRKFASMLIMIPCCYDQSIGRLKLDYW
jgi:hypothetical protein